MSVADYLMVGSAGIVFLGGAYLSIVAVQEGRLRRKLEKSIRDRPALSAWITMGGIVHTVLTTEQTITLLESAVDLLIQKRNIDNPPPPPALHIDPGMKAVYVPEGNPPAPGAWCAFCKVEVPRDYWWEHIPKAHPDVQIKTLESEGINPEVKKYIPDPKIYQVEEYIPGTGISDE